MKLSMSAGHQNHVRLKVAGGLLALAAGLFSVQARALECGFNQIFTENISLSTLGINISTAGEDAPIGKVLYSSKQSLKVMQVPFYCTVTIDDLENGYPISNPVNMYTQVDVLTTPYGPAVRKGDEDIFPTNVPGVGVIISIEYGTHSNPSKYPDSREDGFTTAFGTMSKGMNHFSGATIKLVKTGPIAPGTQQVLGSSFPSFQITSGSKNPIPQSNVFVVLNFNGATAIHSKTCQLATSDIEVNLGSHDVSGFNSTGKATEWKNFDIVLQGCPPFYGYGDYKYTELSGNFTNSSTNNVASIVFRSANGVVEGNPLLARLDSSVNAATGVGIELSRRDISESIAMDGSGGFNLPNLPKEDNATYTIPLKARYVQTDTTVKPGLANGSVVFTITYL